METKPERAFVIYSSGERDLTSGARRRRSPIIHTGCSCRRRPTVYKYIRKCVCVCERVCVYTDCWYRWRAAEGDRKRCRISKVHAVSATTPCRGCFDAYNVLYTASAGRRVQFPDLRSDDDNLSPAETVHTHVYNTRSSLHTHYTQQIDTRTRSTAPSAPPSVVEDLRHLFTLRLPNDNL